MVEEDKDRNLEVSVYVTIFFSRILFHKFETPLNLMNRLVIDFDVLTKNFAQFHYFDGFYWVVYFVIMYQCIKCAYIRV